MTIGLRHARLEIEGHERSVLSPLRRLIRSGGAGGNGGTYRVKFSENAASLARASRRPSEEGTVSRIASADFALEADCAGSSAEIFLKKGGVSEEILADLAIQALSVLASPRGWFVLHSGAVARDGRALVLVGRSMSGKTSLSLSLAARGFTLLSDEANILRRAGEGYRVTPFPLYTQIREAAFKHLPSLKSRRAKLPKTSGGKWILPSRRAASEPVLGRLVFLEYAPSSGFRMEKIAPDALTPVFEACTSGYLSFRPARTALLDYVLTLRDLCRRGLVYRCVYADANRPRALDALEKLFGGAA